MHFQTSINIKLYKEDIISQSDSLWNNCYLKSHYHNIALFPALSERCFFFTWVFAEGPAFCAEP